MGNHAKLPENQKWSSKNEFFIFEAETLFIDHLEYPKFPVIKRKNESEVKMIKFWSIQVFQNTVYLHGVLKYIQ